MLTKRAIYDWVTQYLETFREKALGTDWSRYQVSNLDDFRKPLQVIVFPIQPVGIDATVTLLLGLRLPGQPDGLVDVLEPMTPAETPDRVDQFLADSRWDAELSDQMTVPGEHHSARGSIAHAVGLDVQEFEGQIL